MANIVHTIKLVADAKKAQADIRLYQDQIVAAAQTVKKYEATLNGDQILRAANNWTAAVAKLGGATKDAASAEQLLAGAAKLSASEKEKVNRIITEAIEKYRLLGKEAPAAMRDLAAATTKVEEPTRSWGDVFKGTIAGYLTGAAVIGAARQGLHALTDLVVSSVEAYSKQEQAVKRMTTALVAQGQATPLTIRQYADLAAQFQRTTVYSDELINEMQALLVQVGNVMPHQMAGALQAATNLASGLGVDLRTATMLVGKAFEGETGTLKRYGIVIDETKLKTDGASAVLDAIQQKFGGQAQAEVDTYAGKVKQLANAWDEVKESIGEVIITDPFLQAGMKQVQQAVMGVNREAAGGKASLLDWWIALTGGTNSAWMNLWLKQAELILRTRGEIAAQLPSMRPPAPVVSQPPMRGPAPGADAMVQSVLRDTEAIRAAEQARKKWTQAEKESIEESKRLIAIQQQYNTLMRDTPALLAAASRGSFLASSAQGELNRVLHEGADVWLRQQEVMTIVPLKTLPGIQIEIDKTIPKVKEVTVDFGALATSLAQLAQVAGAGVFSGILQGLSTVVNAADAAQKGVATFKEGLSNFGAGGVKGFLAGFSSMASGILGIASAAISAGKAIWNIFDRNKGRDAVKDFAESFGGFAALREELNKLGDEGEALWVKLTQGVGRNNPEQAARVIAEVEAALAKYKETQADATVLTEEGAIATMESATQASLALDTLNEKIRDNAAAWDAWSDEVIGYIRAVAAGVGGLMVPLPPGGGGTGGRVENGGAQATGGDYWVTRPTMFLAGERGPERATFTPAGSSGASDAYVPVTLNIEGEPAWHGLLRVAKRKGWI